MSQTEAYLVLLASDIGSMELLSSLECMNLRNVLGIYRPEFAARHTPPGSYITDDFERPETLLEKVEGWRAEHSACFTSLVGLDDEEQFGLSALIARRYGLPFYSEHTLRRASNKWLMKLAFLQHGVPTAACALIDDPTTLLTTQVGYPSVLKMLGGSGSEYIMLNPNQAELAANLAYLQETAAGQSDAWFRPVDAAGQVLDPRRQFMLEQFLAGDEYSCDFLYDGAPHVLRVVRKYPGRHLGYFAAFHLLNTDSLQRAGVDLGQLEVVCGAVARALGIRSGVCMVDFMMTGRGLQVIESSVRPGLSTFVPLMQQIYGYTSLALLVELRQGRPAVRPIPRREGLVVHIVAPTTGRVRRFDTAAVERMPGVIGVHCYSGVGTLVSDSRTDHWDSLLGYVLIQDPPAGQIESLMAAIGESIGLEIQRE